MTFVGLKAEVRTPCGLWPEDLASGSSVEGWKNEPYANFGCATQSVIAAQVDDPRDFVQSRALAPSDVAMRTRAIEDVRKGQDPGTAWSTNLTPIGGTMPMSAVSVRDDAATHAVHQIDPVPRVSIQAFCESPEVADLIGAATADRRMAKAHVKHNMGGAAAAVEAYRNAPTPNVIVLEAPADRGHLIEQLDELAHSCDAGTKVVVLGKTNDIVLYRQLMARGVNEYLVAPFEVVDFVRAISELFRGPGAKPLGRLIAVVGAKGGVGASTVAHNLAWCLASVTDMATIIADFDLAFGTAGLDYNQDPRAGRRRGCVRARNASTACSWIGFCPNAATTSVFSRRRRPSIASSIFRKRHSTPCSTRCAPRRHGSCSICRTCGAAGPAGR